MLQSRFCSFSDGKKISNHHTNAQRTSFAWGTTFRDAAALATSKSNTRGAMSIAACNVWWPTGWYVKAIARYQPSLGNLEIRRMHRRMLSGCLTGSHDSGPQLPSLKGPSQQNVADEIRFRRPRLRRSAVCGCVSAHGLFRSLISAAKKSAWYRRYHDLTHTCRKSS